MSSELGFRLTGMLVLALLGARLGVAIRPVNEALSTELFALLFGLVGALVGLILTPYVTTRPARLARQVIREMPAEILLTSLIGLIIGLVIAALLAFPLGLLPPPLREWVPSIMAVVAAYLCVTVFAFRAQDVLRLLRMFGRAVPEESRPVSTKEDMAILTDTSVIIDGRLLDIARTGFIFGKIVIPGFVLRQIQHIADESDPLRRNRGKRGLEILEELQRESKAPVEIVDVDTEAARAVDDKLVVLAKQMNAYLLTTDHNLNRTATLQGVRVLNVNELANAVKAMLLPNEVIPIKITAEGREAGQGVGYLDDGTMVVVEDGKRYLDRTIYVNITRMIQTAAGKMYFARPTDNPGR